MDRIIGVGKKFQSLLPCKTTKMKKKISFGIFPATKRCYTNKKDMINILYIHRSTLYQNYVI